MACGAYGQEHVKRRRSPKVASPTGSGPPARVCSWRAGTRPRADCRFPRWERVATGTWALGRRTCCPPRRFTPRLPLPALATSPQLTSGQSVPVGHTLGDHGLAQQLPRQRSRQGQSRGTRSRARPAGGEARPPDLPASSVAHLLRHEWPLWRRDERKAPSGWEGWGGQARPFHHLSPDRRSGSEHDSENKNKTNNFILCGCRICCKCIQNVDANTGS